MSSKHASMAGENSLENRSGNRSVNFDLNPTFNCARNVCGETFQESSTMHSSDAKQKNSIDFTSISSSPPKSASSTSDNSRPRPKPPDVKMFRITTRPASKKIKPPDISKEISQCRLDGVRDLDLSSRGYQQLSDSAFKDALFLNDLFLYDNKLTSLPSSIGHLSNLCSLLAQQNCLIFQGIPVEIRKLTKLENLDLRSNRLEGPLPPHICELPSLKQLLLMYNKLTSIEGVAKLKSLTVFVVSRNSLRQAVPDCLGQLTHLTTLDLSYNQITSLPESIGNCVALRDLDLQHNHLERLPESMGKLINLTRLAIKYNQLKQIPASLSECKQLDEFNVENNKLESLPDDLLSLLPKLQKITLSRNCFRAFPSGDPTQFLNCTSLNMDHNQITAISEAVLSRANVLNKLNLRDNEIRSLIPSDLLRWTSITELDLGSNHLSYCPGEIGALKNLEVLRLNYNHLTSLPDEIGTLGKLRILDVESNQLECLPSDLSKLVSLKELNVLCNRLRTFPSSLGTLSNLKVIKAGDNEIHELPPELGNMHMLHELHLNDNASLDNLPVEITQCSNLKILNLENCPLSKLPPGVVQGGSPLIIYFLQQVVDLRRQRTAL